MSARTTCTLQRLHRGSARSTSSSSPTTAASSCRTSAGAARRWGTRSTSSTACSRTASSGDRLARVRALHRRRARGGSALAAGGRCTGRIGGVRAPRRRGRRDLRPRRAAWHGALGRRRSPPASRTGAPSSTCRRRPHEVWEWLNDPRLRSRWVGERTVEVELPEDGRTGPGAGLSLPSRGQRDRPHDRRLAAVLVLQRGGAAARRACARCSTWRLEPANGGTQLRLDVGADRAAAGAVQPATLPQPTPRRSCAADLARLEQAIMAEAA